MIGAKTVQVAGGVFMLRWTRPVHGHHAWAAFPRAGLWAIAKLMTIVAYREPY